MAQQAAAEARKATLDMQVRGTRTKGCVLRVLAVHEGAVVGGGGDL
jgi:hypothetical protein